MTMTRLSISFMTHPVCVYTGCSKCYKLWVDAAATIGTFGRQSVADVANNLPCGLRPCRGPTKVWSWPTYLQRHE